MPIALYALTAGAFGIGVTEFVIMGLLREIGADLSVTIAQAGLLISGYALGVVFGAPIMTISPPGAAISTALTCAFAEPVASITRRCRCSNSLNASAPWTDVMPHCWAISRR